jgi:hypothetical protein
MSYAVALPLVVARLPADYYNPLPSKASSDPLTEIPPPATDVLAFRLYIYRVLCHLFGLSLVVAIVKVGDDDRRYVVPTTCMGSAKATILAANAPGLEENFSDFETYFRGVKAKVPWCQPRVNALVAKLLAALGIDTDDLELGNMAYTVMTKHGEEVVRYFDAHASVPKCADDFSIEDLDLKLEHLRHDCMLPSSEEDCILLRFFRLRGAFDDEARAWAWVKPRVVDGHEL